MLIKREKSCAEIRANDGCRLRELLHPERDPVSISYSLAIASVDQGDATSPHTLKETEVYWILQGTGEMHIGEETAALTKGDVVVIPPEMPQWIRNIGKETLVFAAIVSPPWTPKHDIRLV